MSRSAAGTGPRGCDRRTFLAGGAVAATLLPAPPTPTQRAMDPSGRLQAVLAGYVERGELPGAVGLVGHRGALDVAVVGRQAFGGAPMRRDTLFRIASLTKPIAAAAAMALVEAGVLRLDDPVDRWLPELAGRRVLRAPDAALDDTVPARRPITLRDLLTMRAGIGAIMARPGTLPIQRAMAEAGVAPGPDLLALDPDEAMRRFGSLPLAHHPGEGWLYHSGAEILGVLLARAAGRSLGAVLHERILQPLGMEDTAFAVPPPKVARLATAYRGDLAVYDEAAGGRFTRVPRFESAGGGLVSTADDLLAFGRMLLGGGTLHGRRVLSRASVELMTMDHTTAAQREGAPFFLGEHRGWGFGMAVQLRRDQLWSTPGRFGWDGGYGTSAWTDPGEGVVGILLTQRMMDSPAPPPVFTDFWTAVYASLE
jgi:CubicO group peptidase (beta-lactamase class C family)